MSTATMNWALRQELATIAQQGLLYVIADSTDVRGITRHCTPEYMEQKARMTRATMFRRLGELEEYGLLERQKFFTERGEAIYEIRLNLTALIKLPIKRRKGSEEEGLEDDAEGGHDVEPGRPESQIETLPESQPATMMNTIVPCRASPQSHSCDYISPSLPREDSPPYPPPGGTVSREEGQAGEKREALWERFRQGYPGIATMDQHVAREELDALTLDDAEWAVSVLPALKEELRKAHDRPPKNAHIWLRKAMFRNFERGSGAPGGEARALVRYRSDSCEGEALIILHGIGRAGLYDSGTVAYAGEMTPQILAFAKAGPLSESRFTDDPRHIAAWNEFISSKIHRPRASMSVTQGLGVEQRTGIKVPWPFPPSKDGTIYEWPEQAVEAAATDEPPS